jgi:glycosyltransferase involved in cell wall biosynthesis
VPKKALIICEVFSPEDFLINEVAQNWIENNIDFEVLTRTPSYPFGKVFKGFKNRIYQKNKFNNILVHRFCIVPGYNKNVILKILNYLIFVVIGSIIALFIGKRFDRVFIYQTGPLTLALPAILIKKAYGAKLTIWTQDLWPETVYAYGFKKNLLLSTFLNNLVKVVYKNCSVILVTCEGFIPKIEKIVQKKIFYWIPNWPPHTSDFKLKHKLPGDFNFTFAGNIGKVQNLEQILLGFKSFAESNLTCYLNIIGDGSNLTDLIHLVSKEKILNVNFTGRKSIDEMPAYFEASDVLILSLIDVPIYEITIPAKFQAYLKAGKPMFAAMNGIVKTMVEKNKLGITANPSDIQEISLCFNQFVNMDESQLAAFSYNCRSFMQNNFSRETLLKNLRTIFWDN